MLIRFIKSFNFKFLSLFFIFVLIIPKSHSAEIYTLVTNDCAVITGIFIFVDDENVELLTISGKSKKVKRDRLDYILIYNTHENPISKIYTDDILKSNMRIVNLGEDGIKQHIGWPVRFLDDLVLFYDVHGKTHIFDMYSISKIRPLRKEVKTENFSLNSEQLHFSLGDLSGHCSISQSSKRNLVLPLRVLGDKIRITEFLSNFSDGFEKIRSYEERTYLYAKPYLFEKNTRMGFHFYEPTDGINENSLSWYFRWSTGEPYRFQSYNVFGTQETPLGSNIEPQFLFSSELKSHIFHGAFVGNLRALPAGTEFFTPLFSNLTFENIPDIGTNFESGRIRAISSLNYLAFMGLDWGHFSFSFGNYYPIFLLQAKNEYREILASQASPIFRLRYIKKNWDVFALFSMTDYQSKSLNDYQISISDTVSVEEIVNRFDFKTYFIRGGINIFLSEYFQVGLDSLVWIGEYNEKLESGEDQSFTFNKFNTTAYVKNTFGEYVSVKGFVKTFIDRYEVDLGTVNETTEGNQVVYGGVFELIF